MKAKHEKVCHNCRDHKIGCDGKLPSCTQCSLTGRKCGGYKLDMVFVPYSAKPPASKKISPSPVNLINTNYTAPRSTVGHNSSPGGTSFRQVDPCQIAQPIDAVSSDELIAIIRSRFVPRRKDMVFDTSASQVCASWVEMLPSIIAGAHSKELIRTAVRAFGMILLDRGLEGKHESFHSIEAYVTTLQHLNSALQTRESFFRIETAAAIACLAMVELMLPKPDGDTMAHFGGLGAVINMFSPDVFSSRDFHAIFVGCRPVLLFQALTARKSTFLGQEDWLTVPFRYHSPSDMQMIMGDVTVLPSVMEEIDGLQALRPEIAAQRARNLKVTLSEVLARLSRWDRQFDMKAIPKHRSSQHMETTDCRQDELSDFWFPDLLAANIHTHIWTFQIICHTELTKLTYILRKSDGISIPNVGLGWEEHSASLSTLATRICQCMEYFLQEDMMLYGPATAMFPLTTAYKVLTEDLDGSKEQIKRYRAYFDRLRNKGFLSASMGTTEARSRV